MDRPISTGVRCYSFAPFVLDLGKRELWRDGRRLPLTAKTFDVLTFLIANRNRVVTKDEFFTHVWPDTIVLEANLVRQISLLRRAFDQRLEDHDFLVTIPGRGYQFVAEVTELAALSDTPSEKPSDIKELDEAPQLKTNGSPAPADEAGPGGNAVVAERGPLLLVRSVRLSGVTALTVGITAALLLGMLALTWFLSRQDRAVTQGPALLKFTFDAAFPREPTWSPDGGSLAYTSDKSGNADIWVQSLVDPTPRQVTTSSAQDWQPHWSPVSDQIAFRSETDGGGLFMVSATGGTPRRLTTFGHSPKWSPDGKRILFSDLSVRYGVRRLFVIDVSGGVAREIAVGWMEKLRSLSVSNSVNAAWDPAGQHVSLWSRFEGSDSTFVTVSVADGTARASQISEAVQENMRSRELKLGNFVWSPSGRNLYFEGRLKDAKHLWRVGVDPKTKEWISGPERMSLGTTDDVELALSPDGSRLAFSAQTTQTRVWMLPFDSTTGRLTGAPEPVTPGNTVELGGDVSKDGSQLAYRALRNGREEIWAYSMPERRERLLLASATARRTSPFWSPDGTQLVYARRVSDSTAGRSSLAILPTLGGDERVLTVPDEIRIEPRDWSRDGHTIVGSCRNSSMTRLGTCLVSVSDGSSSASVAFIAYNPAISLYCQRFSPNQEWVSFLGVNRADPTVSRVYIVSVSGGPWTPVTDGLSFEDKPRWAPDGRTLYFVSNRSGTLNVWGRHIDPMTGTPKGEAFQVTSYSSNRFRLSPQLAEMEIAVARDRLFVPVAETTGAIWILENLLR